MVETTGNGGIRGVEFISKDLTESDGTTPLKVTLLKSPGSNEVKLQRMFNNLCMSREHGKLEFTDDGKIMLYDLGSSFGTYVYSRNKSLKTGEPCEIKHGDSIIFGSKKYEPKGSPAVRVVFKLLDKELEVVSKPPISHNTEKPARLEVPQTRHRANKSDSDLAESLNLQKGRRRLSGQSNRHLALPKDRNTANSRDPTPSPSTRDRRSPNDSNGTTTVLQREIIIPWRSGLRLGDGIDALTGEAMRCALASTRSHSDGAAPTNEHSSTEILSHQNLNSLRNEYDIGVGATINAPVPVEFGAEVRSIFSTESSTSTIFVQYQVEGKFPMERLDNPELRRELRNMPSDKFRKAYGDYYISGIERGYCCRIIVACSVKDYANTKSAEVEARTTVANFFGARGKIGKERKHSDNCTLLNATVQLWGYNAGEIQFTGGTLERALEALENLRERGAPPGLPKSVLLHHYSTLDYCTLSREIGVSSQVFSDIHQMRRIYSQLQVDLLHPALDASDTYFIWTAMQEFRDGRDTFAQDSREASSKRAAVLKDLRKAKQEADGSIKKYNLIQQTRQMDKEFRRFGPFGNRYKWECGHLGKETGKTNEKGWKIVRLKSGEEVYEIDWFTPKTRGSKFGTLGAPRPQPLRLWAENAHSVLPGYEPEQPRSTTSFEQRIVGERITILGWSLSCDWDSKKEPEITVRQMDNCILRSGFWVDLDNSVSTVWHCRITFVVTDHM